MNKTYNIWICFIVILINTICSAGSSSTLEQGPRLSDTELLASLDPNCHGLNRVIAFRDRGEISAAPKLVLIE